MKRYLSLILSLCFVLASVLCLSSCEGEAAPDGAVTEAAPDAQAVDIDMTDATFKGWISEFNSNPGEYIGKRIHLEGVMFTLNANDTKKTYYMVYRDGCCADDHMYSMEFVTNGEVPKDGEWIDVTGTFSSYMEGTKSYTTLMDATVTVKPEKGQVALGL